MSLDVINTAQDLYSRGLYSKAISTLLLVDSDEPLVNYLLGLSYIKSGDFLNGRSYLEDFISEDNNLLRIFQTNMLIAYASIMIEDFKGAEVTLKNLLDSGFESAKLYSLLGYTYYRRGIPSKSISSYRKSLNIESDNSNALNALGYILSDYPEDLKEAETLCRRALSIDVDNPAYLDSIGWVCYKNRKIKASESFLLRALDLAPGNRDIIEHINEVKGLRNS